jgi:adenylosuccinate lyase
MRSFHEQRDFKELLLGDPDVMKVLTRADVEKAFGLTNQLRNVDAIFDRVFHTRPAMENTLVASSGVKG